MSALLPAASYRERVQTAVTDGDRFAGLYAADGGRRVSVVLLDANGTPDVVSAEVLDGIAPTIVDLVPAAGWDEREAHDGYGVRFDGHEPLRPLVTHTASNDAWTVPVRGSDPYEVAVGPIHAGVIESGHFRFHVVGERILHLDARLFYKHRGLERAAERVPLADGLCYVARACAACSVSNAVAYAHACEEIRGVVMVPELARVRTILLELERVWNHLNDIGAICAGVGLAAGTAYFGVLTERARRLNARLTGHRFLAGSVRVGGSDVTIPGGEVATVATELADIAAAARSGERELMFNPSFQDRLPDVGVLPRADAVEFGTVGPAARAAGITEDVRAQSPNLAYDGFSPAVLDRAVGDVQARFEQRAAELGQSFAALAGLLDTGPIRPIDAPIRRRGRRVGVGVGVVESPRGRTVCAVEATRGRIERLHLRTGSYANWPSVAHAATGNLLPDFPLINKSFELCYACVDR
jgi:Ni,Fe-hydrogenase III large subunit